MQFPLSLQGKVSLCHREAGEREKERHARDDGKGKEKKRRQTFFFSSHHPPRAFYVLIIAIFIEMESGS